MLAATQMGWMDGIYTQPGPRIRKKVTVQTIVSGSLFLASFLMRAMIILPVLCSVVFLSL